MIERSIDTQYILYICITPGVTDQPARFSRIFVQASAIKFTWIAERSRKSLEWRRLIAFYSFILQKFFFQFSRPALRKSVKRPMFSS